MPSPRTRSDGPCRAVFRPGQRLHSRKEFESVRRNGKSLKGRLMIVYEAPGGDPSRARLGLAVSRSVGCAVLRNRVKRRIREAFRLNAGGFKPGTDLLVVARAESATASAAEVARELLSLHTRLAGGR